MVHHYLDFPCVLVIKNLPAYSGDAGSFPILGRSLGEENGNLLQYSCLGNLRDRGAWQATVHGAAKELDTTWRLNSNNNIIMYQL